MNKKESIAKSIAVYKERITQVDEKLKEENLSSLQRNMFETEKKIANDDIKKVETGTK
jgi:hypothetical protein